MRVHLSLGTNLGDRARNLCDALQALAQVAGVQILIVSPVYETEPVGVCDQPAFYNLAVEIETDLPPLELLNAVKQLETQLGREATYPWGPRLIDIDLVLWGNLVLSFERLTLPHPEFRERAFVLAPLRDIAPDTVDPVTGMTVRQLADQPNVLGHVVRLDAHLLEPLRLEPQWDRDGIVTVQETPETCPLSPP